MNTVSQHIKLILMAALLVLGGAAWGQNDPQFVIKRDNHYLAHVKVNGTWQLQDATSFSPNCLWYSGNTVDVTGINHNYYFLDGETYHFLNAPLEPDGELDLSASFPGEQILRNVEQIYYFYNWDMTSTGEGGGVARGLQHTGYNNQVDCEAWGGSWSDHDQECWKVYWAEYKSSLGKWQLSSISSYNITTDGGRFHRVTVNESLTPVEGTGLQSLNVNGTATTSFSMEHLDGGRSLSATMDLPYRYTTYTTYVFAGTTHNYYNVEAGGPSADHGTNTPNSPNGNATSVSTYEWTLTGEGAYYLSFDQDVSYSSSSSATPHIYYIRSNNTGHKTALLTLTITYNDGSQQVKTATILVRSACVNPSQLDYPLVSYDGVTLSWYNTADRYMLYWTTSNEVDNPDVWTNSVEVVGTNTYTLTGLEYNTNYHYKVAAICGDSELPNPSVYDFTTNSQPDLMIYGSVFGGGRVANVTGNTTVVVINCDTIGAVYGGNDIAGEVQGENGSNIILGVDASSASDSYSHLYNNNQASVKVRVNDVYGGGNGYYAYDGTSFQAASSDYASQTVAAGGNVMSMTQSNQVGEVAWTNESDDPYELTFPKIVKTSITVANNQVKVDSIFGGAKNAFLTASSGNGASILIHGGTVFAVFGGNNVGGGQGYAHHYVRVTGTTTNLEGNIANTATMGYGRDFGIRYLFGGGNKVYGSTTDVFIEGGQLDTIFAGGNSADVYAANMTVNCSLAAGSGTTFGNTYSNAFVNDTYNGTTIAIKDGYEWDGISGIYNVRTLFGGNNEASFDSRGNNAVPAITLTSGSLGTVYGGGNSGDMLARHDGTVTLEEGDDISMKYSTHVVMDSPNTLVDYLYGGCQVSNVDYSTWVEIQDGHVGHVYGGCNVSGDVGSTRLYPNAPGPKSLEYQAVQGSTYVKATGGIVYKNLFAGSNGFYHCNDGVYYVASAINYGDLEGRYIGLSIPTHNETYAIIGTGSRIKGNVYAGGNLAPVGYTDITNGGKPFPAFVGLASVRMEGGTVDGDVYGGGNMAAIQGSNEVRVLGGTIGGALYGGNDRLGMMAQISNRILPSEYDIASDEHTSLLDMGVRTYVSVSGRPNINTVYGGGNGAYDYSGTANGGDMDYCNPGDQPIQSYTFVDIHIDGSPDDVNHIPAGHINTVYGGGNGVTVGGAITVFVNVQNPNDSEHISTIFGGNNMGDLSLMPDIVLLHGNVGTVYGGCNQGAMIGRYDLTLGGTTYHDLGSMVHLRNQYIASNSNASPTTYTIIPTAKVLDAVYGGCRMNGVQYDDLNGTIANTNTLVLVEGGTHPATMFGGSDISGTISGTSQVVVAGGTIGNAIGGGNGYYTYNTDGTVYTIPTSGEPQLVATGVTQKPFTTFSRIDMRSGTANNLYAGGNACASGATLTEMTGGNVLSGIYGGCNAQDVIQGDVVVNVLGGTVGTSASHANIHGGGYGAATETEGNVTVNIGATTGGENPTYSGTAVIYGDVYGGSALGQVSASNKLTQVNFYKGIINGNVYGGGLGNSDYPAEVSGDVEVNIHGGVFNAVDGTLGGGQIFGCNNANGTPLGNVNVNIYATDHGTTPQTNLYPTTPSGGWTVEALAANAALPQAYAIGAVYGGGNEASYTPTATGKSATVHVYNCDNTINDVYGGGNAANVGTTDMGAVPANTFVIVDGGRINRVFGGGNGEVTPANIYGTATTTVNAGLVNQIFGCGNMNGSITATQLDLRHPNNGCEDEVFGEVFGGANQATFTGNLTTGIICGVGQIGSIYGGSNLAPIDGDVTLTISGGDFKEVYGGSKGADAQSADITGNVTLNLEGGTIIQAFGGSNVNGNITGLITVNVDTIAGDCPLVLDTLFGSGNLTAYTPNQVESNLITSPVVNLKNGTVRKAVFGSGKGASATVTANPLVNIGDTDNSPNRLAQVGYMEGGTVYGGDIYGGGFEGPVAGGPVVNIRKANTMVYNSVFGGGDMANVGSTVVNMDNGTVKTGIYGGCNLQGTVGGNIEVNIVDGVLGVDGTPMPSGIFGGGYGHNTSTSGNVVVNIGDATNAPTIYADVYGGSALGNVHALNTSTDRTTVNFAKGTLHGNLYGGGLGQAPDISAEVNGSVVVNIGKDKNGTIIDGTTIVGSVFGANNVKGSPKGSVEVNLYKGTLDSIFGGGNQADYVPTNAAIDYPAVNITSGQVIYKVVGGGNAAGVTANPHINISGGKICTIADGNKAGIYGGCNTTGTVDGNIYMLITSPKAPSADTTVIGTNDALQYALDNDINAISIHGGGYGAGTATTGNITVDYGVDDGSEGIENRYPKLYGDLYGGSALGTVNNDASDATTVNVLNGSFELKSKIIVLPNGNRVLEQFGGYIYGGGLGDATHAADVNGVVHVNIGRAGDASNPAYGKAYLKGCNVFGCNNTKGSPLQEVFVDVYQTAHEEIDSVHYDGDQWNNYAIRNVYGGGNRAHYTGPNTNNTVHYCNNTIQYVYGGGNAADTYGTTVKVDGGRFQFIFGGGNGQSGTEANIGGGGVHIAIYGGHVGWFFNGCNLHGFNSGDISEQYGCTPDYCPCEEELDVENYYFGANEALTLGGLEHTINCGDKMEFKNVYAGSRLAVVYGDIKITVRGGNIGNLFGGSEGSDQVSADVRKYPSTWDSATDDPQLVDYMDSHPELAGTGGNITVVLEGGKIGNVFGGNNFRGDIEGNITIIVDSTQVDPCQLEVDYIYGGSNLARYAPDGTTGTITRVSPKVFLKHGHVNGAVFGGSRGGDPNHHFGNGIVYSNPLVVIGDPSVNTHKAKLGGNLISVSPTVPGKGDVFGGGNAADLIGSPKVYVQGKATIDGNVFGGGEFGLVDGHTNVYIDPQGNDTILPPVTPTPRHKIYLVVDPAGSGTVSMSLGGNPVSSGDLFPEGTVLNLSVDSIADGYIFDHWEVNGVTIVTTDPTTGATTYTVGIQDATITAKFINPNP